MSATGMRLWSMQLSPYAGNVRVVLAEKGIECELHEIHPIKRPSGLKELNPLGRVPVLEVDGRAIRESSVIVEWIEETHPEPALWPDDPADRAWLRAWAKWIEDEITNPFTISMRKFVFGKADDDPEDIIERLQSGIAEAWPILEEQLAVHDGPWLLGETITLADLTSMSDAVRLPQWTPHVLPDPDRFPLVTAWYEALRSRPSAAQIDAKGDPVHRSDSA